MDQFLELDARVYQSKDQVCRKTLLTRLKCNPQTDVILTEKDILIGYISLCPVSKQTFSDILQQKLTEDEIENNVIPYVKPGVYYAYLSSIVIDKTNFPHFSSKFLIKGLQEHVLRMRRRGIFIENIIAKAVSIAGRKTLLKMNFKELHDNLFIFSFHKIVTLFIPSTNRSFSYNLRFVRIIEIARRGFV